MKPSIVALILFGLAAFVGGVVMLFALASLGLPGLGNFIGEFLILFGVYPAYPVAAVFAALGLVAASIYALWIVQHTFHRGDAPKMWQKFVPALTQYVEAFHTDIWQERQSGLCRGGCPVKKCAYWTPKPDA